jgi:hypothetical protein
LSWLLLLLLLLLLVLLRVLLPLPALRLRAAALQEILHVGGSIQPASPNPDSRMEQLPPKHPQRPWQALIIRPSIGQAPRCVLLCSRLQTPDQGVQHVIHGWGGDML